MKPALVLACGNTLRGDDGVALHIGSVLQEELSEAGVEVILTRQLQPEHAELLSRTSTAIFLDCSAIAQAGVVSTLALSASESAPRIFTHQLDPASLLRLAHDLYGSVPNRSVSITIGGQSFELEERLSEPVAAAIPLAIQAIYRTLSAPEAA